MGRLRGFRGRPFCVVGSGAGVAVLWQGFWTGGVGEFVCGDVAGGGGDAVEFVELCGGDAGVGEFAGGDEESVFE